MYLLHQVLTHWSLVLSSIFPQCPRGFQKLPHAMSPKDCPSLGHLDQKAWYLQNKTVGEKHRFPKPWCCSHRPNSKTCLWAAWICLGQSVTEPNWAEGLWLLSVSYVFLPPWFMSAQEFHMVFPAEPTFIWISKHRPWSHSLHKGMDVCGGRARALNLAQKGTGRIIPWAVPQTTGEPWPSCPQHAAGQSHAQSSSRHPPPSRWATIKASLT